MTQPARATNQIQEKVESLKVGRVNFDSIEVASLFREIKSLRKTNAADSFMLEGMLYAKAMMVERAIAAHEKSIELSNEAFHLGNYATSLVKLNKFIKGAEYREQLLSSGFINTESVRSAVWVNAALLRFRRAQAVIEKYGSSEWFDREVAPSDYYYELKKLIPEFLMFASNNNLSLDQIELIGEHLASVLATTESVARLSTIEMRDFYGKPFISILHFVNAPPEEVHQLNMRLVDLISADDRIECWDRVIPELRVLPDEAMYLVD